MTPVLSRRPGPGVPQHTVTVKAKEQEYKQGRREGSASLDLNRLPWYGGLKERKTGNWRGKRAGALENRDRVGKRGGGAHTHPGVLQRSGPRASLGSGKQTYRQYLLLALLCHTGPPALHRFLFKKGHKPLRVESVVQQVQGALLCRLGRLGHAAEIQLQGAYGREGSLSEGVSVMGTLSHRPWAQPQVRSLRLRLSVHALVFHLHSLPPSAHLSICPLMYPTGPPSESVLPTQPLILLCTDPFIHPLPTSIFHHFLIAFIVVKSI